MKPNHQQKVKGRASKSVLLFPVHAEWQLTQCAALDRESERAEPNLRWRGIPGECANQTSHLERGDSPTCWPFYGVGVSRVLTRRRRKLVADKFGSPNIRKFESSLMRGQMGPDVRFRSKIITVANRQ